MLPSGAISSRYSAEWGRCFTGRGRLAMAIVKLGMKLGKIVLLAIQAEISKSGYHLTSNTTRTTWHSSVGSIGGKMVHYSLATVATRFYPVLYPVCKFVFLGQTLERWVFAWTGWGTYLAE